MNERSRESTRQRILSASQKVFAEHGYTGANMRLIAQGAAVSVGCVYLYFKCKDELYLTLLESWMNELDAWTTDALENIVEPAEALAAFITTGIVYAREHKEMVLLQGRDLGFARGLEMKQQFLRKRRSLIEDIVRKGVATGIFCDCDPGEAAKIIFCTMRGFIVTMMMGEEALYSPEAGVELLLNGLLRRDTP